MNNELAKVCPAARSELTAHCVDMAMLAIRAEGMQTLLLPGPAVTAAHEAGHAVLHAVQSNPPWCVWIKYYPMGGGYTGSTDFHPDAPGIYIKPVEEPDAAINRACSTVAGWAAEYLFEKAGLKMGSSIDELTVAGNLTRAAAMGMGCNAENLWMSVIGATMYVLQREAVAVRAIQRLLLRENRIRGPKLAGLLSAVEKRDMAALVLTGPQRDAMEVQV